MAGNIRREFYRGCNRSLAANDNDIRNDSVRTRALLNRWLKEEAEFRAMIVQIDRAPEHLF